MVIPSEEISCFLLYQFLKHEFRSLLDNLTHEELSFLCPLIVSVNSLHIFSLGGIFSIVGGLLLIMILGKSFHYNVWSTIFRCSIGHKINTPFQAGCLF